MIARPDLVAGDKREDTLLMRAVPGLVSKGGAEAIGVVALGDGRTIALKVADGSERARLPVVLALLDRLGVEVPAGAVPVPPILGHGQPVGATVSLVP
jgi:L-asparaginase II